MKLPKEFQYYVRKGIIRKSSKDKPRASFLEKESEVSFDGLRERVKIIGINERNANSIIKDCYDIIMELIRAKLFLAGYSSSGNYSHEGEVAFLFELGFEESDISFLNGLRYYRNSVTYYGKLLDKDYAVKVFDFIVKILPKLREK